MSLRDRLGGARLLQWWEALRTSYWFVPSVMTAGAVGLSFATVHLDEGLEYKWIRTVGWIWAGGPEGAREVLSTIAGSMITVAGVVFSITIVALTLASSQFGPRLLRNFMRDLGNQVVLGTFIATYVYCLLVLRTVRTEDGDGAEFVPYVSVTLGVAFALASLGVLIFFIHHVAFSIQAENLIAVVAGDLDGAVEEMFPEKLGEPGPAPEEAPPSGAGEAGGFLVRSHHDGYLQAIDEEDLMAVACAEDRRLELLQVPGGFVIAGGPLARVWPAGGLGEEAAGRIRGAFLLARHRTPTQDPEHAVRQLVEIGVRALSPGINDPFTTLTCIDWLGAALSKLAGRRIPSPYRYGGGGTLRIIAAGPGFPEMADAAFHPIRQYGRGSVMVLLRLLDTLAAVSGNVRRAGDLACLHRHADEVVRDARAALVNESDLRKVEERHAATSRALERAAARLGPGEAVY